VFVLQHFPVSFYQLIFLKKAAVFDAGGKGQSWKSKAHKKKSPVVAGDFFCVCKTL
jgi:hypothetical protein